MSDYKVLSGPAVGVAAFALVCGGFFGFLFGDKRATEEYIHTVVTATGGLFPADIEKMRDECEAALPRNQHCELTFTPSEVFNGRMVEESPGRTD